MTTEQRLRLALAEIGGMVAALLAAHHGGGLLSPEMTAELTSAEIEARAALALPPSETREEWMVRYESQEFYPERWEARESIAGGRAQAEWIIRTVIGDSPLYRNARIESRTVSASPWSEVTSSKEQA